MACTAVGGVQGKDCTLAVSGNVLTRCASADSALAADGKGADYVVWDLANTRPRHELAQYGILVHIDADRQRTVFYPEQRASAPRYRPFDAMMAIVRHRADVLPSTPMRTVTPTMSGQADVIHWFQGANDTAPQVSVWL